MSTNHLKTINDALHSLLISYSPELSPLMPGKDLKWKRNEFMRYWCTAQNHISSDNDGETREYTYEINHYFNFTTLDKPKIVNTVFGRLEDVKETLMESRTYQPSSVYKWHDLAINNIEVLKVEEEEPLAGIYYIKFELTLKRFNQWS